MVVALIFSEPLAIEHLWECGRRLVCKGDLVYSLFPIHLTDKMTKLMEWLTGAFLILGPWTAVVSKTIQNEFTDKYYIAILIFPVILVAIFGLVSVAIIAYRVYNFNDCNEAAEELKTQIKEAKEDLTKKGLKLD
ncbi:Dolichol-phosphate mannosyltransferase subunit 3 [Halocaridina rubra]|uniref:Dolichol-phosphate mannosyltransferase subunit 3 n=1 Tax=Halocaridina rubra TaxID=373956 RepID=A0AAN8WE54_HALRR